jgi:hypothetical protein
VYDGVEGRYLRELYSMLSWLVTCWLALR